MANRGLLGFVDTFRADWELKDSADRWREEDGDLQREEGDLRSNKD